MAGAVRIALPPDLADELISEGEVVPSVMTRSIGEVVQIMIDGVNTGSAAVTVAAAATALPRVMQRVAAYTRRHGDAGSTRVLLRHGDTERVLEVPPELTLDDISALLQRSLAEAADGPPG